MARQAGYNLTGGTYDNAYGSRVRRAYHRRRCELLIRAIATAFSQDARLDVLEIGCGTGMTLDCLARSTEHRLVGLDFSITMLHQSADRTRTSPNTPSLLLANAIELPFDDSSFDVVYATRFIHQFPHADKIRVAREISRVLRPCGLALLEFYARPINSIRHYIDRRDAYENIDGVKQHCPARSEVREIVGGRYRVASLRLLGDRIVNRVLGYRAFWWSHVCLGHMPWARLLLNEYWVIYSPSERKGRTISNADCQRHTLLDMVRCSRCKGMLKRDEGAGVLRCFACGLEYAIEGGFPNLLSHETRRIF